MIDLLDVFEVLTDTEKLTDFDDTHGLIIVGFNPDLSGEACDAELRKHQTKFGDQNTNPGPGNSAPLKQSLEKEKYDEISINA